MISRSKSMLSSANYRRPLGAWNGLWV